jgi:hypothetical protein
LVGKTDKFGAIADYEIDRDLIVQKMVDISLLREVLSAQPLSLKVSISYALLKYRFEKLLGKPD